MAVSDSTKEAEGVGSFSKNSGRSSAKAGKNSAINVLKSRGTSLEITSKNTTAAASQLETLNLYYQHCQR